MAMIGDIRNAGGRAIQGGVENVGLFAFFLQAAFVGLPALLRGDRFARRRTVDALSDTALRPLPIVTMLAALTGLVLAFSVSRAFHVANLEEPLLRALRSALMREVMPVLIGIFVAGRSGVALAVRIGRMIAGGEVDSLRLMGVDPANHVLPASLLVFLSAAAALLVWGDGIAHLSAALTLQQFEAIPVARYMTIVFDEGARSDFWFGVLRVEVYAMLALGIASTEGSGAGRDPQTLEAAARRTFVISLLAIFGAAAIFAGAGA